MKIMNMKTIYKYHSCSRIITSKWAILHGPSVAFSSNGFVCAKVVDGVPLAWSRPKSTSFDGVSSL